MYFQRNQNYWGEMKTPFCAVWFMSVDCSILGWQGLCQACLCQFTDPSVCVNLKRKVILRDFLSQGRSYDGVCEVLGVKKLLFFRKKLA